MFLFSVEGINFIIYKTGRSEGERSEVGISTADSCARVLTHSFLFFLLFFFLFYAITVGVQQQFIFLCENTK